VAVRYIEKLRDQVRMRRPHGYQDR